MRLRRRPTARLFCVMFLRQRGEKKVEKTLFHNLEDGVGSRALRASALSQPSPSPSECSFVSGADVLHSCSHGSERTISECEGGSEKKKKKTPEILSPPFLWRPCRIRDKLIFFPSCLGPAWKPEPRPAQIGADKSD